MLLCVWWRAAVGVPGRVDVHRRLRPALRDGEALRLPGVHRPARRQAPLRPEGRHRQVAAAGDLHRRSQAARALPLRQLQQRVGLQVQGRCRSTCTLFGCK